MSRQRAGSPEEDCVIGVDMRGSARPPDLNSQLGITAQADLYDLSRDVTRSGPCSSVFTTVLRYTDSG